jgi:hypothetical protein
MKKNGLKLNERRRFIKDCIHSPERGADELIRKASRLKKAKNIGETVNILCEIFYLSDDTILRDYVG